MGIGKLEKRRIREFGRKSDDVIHWYDEGCGLEEAIEELSDFISLFKMDKVVLDADEILEVLSKNKKAPD